MENIQLKLNDQKRGAFLLQRGNEKMAEMAIAVIDKNLVVYHTEVSDELKGQGVASHLLNEMTQYARNNDLKVVPLCPYVLAQFKRHPEDYADIWNKQWHQ
jgi:uncharacterized protein